MINVSVASANNAGTTLTFSGTHNRRSQKDRVVVNGAFTTTGRRHNFPEEVRRASGAIAPLFT